MSEKGSNNGDSSPNNSLDDITIIEKDAVGELREEVRNLQNSLKVLLDIVNSSSQTEVVPPKQTAETTLNSSTVPSAAAASVCSSQYTKNQQASYLPMQQRLSTNQFSYPNSFYPNLDMPYSASYIPSPSVQTSTSMPSVQTTYMPPTSVQTTPYMPPTSVQTTPYMPPTSVPTTTFMPPAPVLTTTYMPPPSVQMSSYISPSPFQQTNQFIQQPPLTTYLPTLPTQPPTSTTSRQTASAPSTFLPMYASSAAATTQNVFDHRPIRKLHDLPEFNGQPEQLPMFSVSYKETTL